jgi:hypothetical protein
LVEVSSDARPQVWPWRVKRHALDFSLADEAPPGTEQ